MPYQFSTTPLYVAENDLVQFQYQAPPFWDYTETITIQIGGLVTYWYITTVPEDFQPDPFPLNDISNAELNTYYYVDPVVFISPAGPSNTITGLSATTRASVSVTANFTGTVDDYAVRINGGAWINVNVPNVQNGDRIAIRVRSSPNYQVLRRVSLSIGVGFESIEVETSSIPVNAPVPFPNFTDLTAQPLNKAVYSNVLRVTGLVRTAAVLVDSGASFAVSNNNTTATNADGFDVLSGVSFTTTGNITNGQYLQLRVDSPSLAFSSKTVTLSIGDTISGSDWVVTAGAALSTNPTSFIFNDITEAIENSLIASAARPIGGITGLGAGISVPVTLISSTSSEVKVKINNASIGVFPASVSNGDTITLYARSSATFGAIVTTNIKVGGTTIPTWGVQTNNGPDTAAAFTPPLALTNQVPATYIPSSAILVTGINRPITITATNGALISIDNDTAIVGPRTFDPLVNSSFRILLLSASGLNASVSTTVTVGTGSATNPFNWSVSTYAVAPLPPNNRASWYSKKNESKTSGGIVRKSKYDGYSIGTILPVLKESVSGYGALTSGDLTARFPGYLVCDGTSYNANDYPLLWAVIENTYGGNGAYNSVTKTYSGTFNVPDYRNVRMCGTGLVDGNKASSTFLSPTASASGGAGGNLFAVGSTGGYWFIDTVGVAGTDPLEQVEAVANTLTTGTTSQFFSLGTVKTTGANLVTGDVSFAVDGSISSQIGPVSDVVVSAPPHTHFMVTAVTEGASGDPLIPWGQRALFATPFLAPTPVPPDFVITYKSPNRYSDETEATNGPPFFNSFIGIYMSQLGSELTKAGSSLATITSQMTSEGTKTFTFDNWWPSPGSSLDYSKLTELSSGGVAGVIDTEPSTFRISDFTSTSGTTETHNHYITFDRITNPLTDYSYGNAAGFGEGRQGLGGGASTKQIVFNAAGTGLGVNEATFTMNSTIKNPVPTVALSPNRTVPIATPFHKVRYIIKAY